MKRKRITAALLTGIMLCSSIPMNIRASDLDAIFDDGEAAAEDTDGLVTESNNTDMYDVSEEDCNTTDSFTDDEFSDSVGVESEEEADAGQMRYVNKSKIYDDVKWLMLNTDYASYPLLEYDDPVNLAAGFSKTPGGVLQAFIKTYGDINTKNKLWEQEYEEILIDLLADNSIRKRITDAWDEDLASIVSEFEEEIDTEVLDKLSFSMSAFTDSIRNDIKKDVSKILILSSIADNTDDRNLRKACQICMADSLNSTFNAIEDFLIDDAVKKGKKLLVKKQAIKKKVLTTSLKKDYLGSICTKFQLGTVATLVSEILLVKDIVSFASGINKRVDNYLKTVSLSFVCDASMKAYNKKISALKSGDTNAASDIYILFQFILSAKQMSYETMEGMFTGFTWDKIIESDQYLKMNTEKISDITIRNYTKVKLTSLKPDTDTTKIALKVKEKKEFPCTGISYLSNVKYSSDNKKVAKVNSSGDIQAKKAGTTYIRCKVEQYGDTYNLVCKVTVKKEGNTKDPTSAYRNLIQSYEKKYGEAQLNEQKQFWTGLCYAKLLDFNNDGINELILAYQTEKYNKDKVQYHVELWKYDGKSAKRVTSRISWSGNNIPYFGGLGICKYNGKYLLELTGNACWDNYYYGTQKDGSVGMVHKFIWKGDAMEGDWYMDGKKVSGNIYGTYYKKYHANATWYSFAQSSNNSLIRKELSNTKKKLGM
ncbi:hypothetical protein [Blautia sp.]|jgi:hypothetical protein|uniref:hypothetical protein n=1 Tax=Blautia sp. TaxID=1955243 RepID=UPI0025899B63|nr:hypothetical protein [Blautia sp.]